MSKHHIRKDNICQNCGHTVEKRFCSYCGQENVETRQSFGHLVKHFFEDFTHYEGNFWKTIKYLLFRPAYLTKTYLAGKRMAYVAPVKLYIFISFITFFLPAILPHFNTDHNDVVKVDNVAPEDYSHDSTKASQKGAFGQFYASAAAYDSAQNSLPKAQRDNWINRYFNRKFSENNQYTAKEIKEKFAETTVHTLPKALFFYMPLFAFLLWLFHGKKRWLFFDHAIFTLHYFSFLLLVITMVRVLSDILPWHFILSPGILYTIFSIIIICWSLFYFYRAHHRLYEEGRLVSRLKATFIVLLNGVLFLVAFISFVLFVFLTMH